MGSKRTATTATIVCTVALLATACASATPHEQFSAALLSAMADTAFRDEAGAKCATEALVANPGIGELTASGLSTETLHENPSELGGYLAAAPIGVLADVATCADERAEFGAVFVKDVGGGTASGSCASELVTDARAMEVTLEVVRGSDAALAPATDANLVIECAPAEHVVAFLGLPSASEVAEAYSKALVADHQFTRSEATCAGSGVEGVGAIRLHEIGATPESFDDGISGRDFSGMPASEFDKIIDGFIECTDAAKKISAALLDSWPEMQPCLAAKIDVDQARTMSKSLIRGERGWDGGYQYDFRKPINECGNERDIAVFGTITAEEQQVARSVGRGFLPVSLVGPLHNHVEPHEVACMGHGLVAYLGLETVERIDELWQRSASNEEYQDLLAADAAYEDIWAAFVNTRTVCVHAHHLLQDWFEDLGFSDISLRCMRDQITDEEIRNALNNVALFQDLTRINSVTTASEHLVASELLDLVVTDCATPAELSRWDPGTDQAA